ncbi:MAG: TetR/AcrR family transcriptional regulator [Candidatus Microbacterium colombiense]|nr:MAG: TetR/AcrR family transcriptional regulator [Microbacterium sp.]
MVTDARDRMVRTAALLLAKRGLQGASFSEVLTASGAPRGSIYHHFPEGKDQLVTEALALAQARALAALEEHRDRPATEIAQAFVQLWRDVLVASDHQAGCAVVAVTVATEDRALIETAAAVFRDWQDTLADLLRTGGVSADRAASLAALLIAASEGAVIVARAQGSLQRFDAVADELIGAVASAS